MTKTTKCKQHTFVTSAEEKVNLCTSTVFTGIVGLVKRNESSVLNKKLKDNQLCNWLTGTTNIVTS